MQGVREQAADALVPTNPSSQPLTAGNAQRFLPRVHILFCVHLIYSSHVDNDSLRQAFKTARGLCAPNTSLPPRQQNSHRQEDRFRLCSYCAYTNGSGSYSGHAVASRFQPYNATTYILLNYSQFAELVPNSTTRRTSDSTPMSLIIFYSEAYLQPSHCSCE